MTYIKYILTLFLFCCSFCLIANQSTKERWSQFIEDPVNQKVLDLAIQTRAIYSDFSDQLPSLLPDYSAEDFNQSSLLVLQHLTGTDTTLKLEPVGAGFHGDKVYLCKDSQGSLQFVIKWFYSPRHFLHEISSMELLHNLDLVQSEIVSPIALGRATNFDNNYYLIVESPGKGATIKSLIDRISYQQDGDKRKEALGLVEKAVSAQGRLIGELHSYSNTDVNYKSDYMEWNIESIAARLKSRNDRLLSIDDLVQPVKNLITAYQKMPHAYHYNHGDPNLGNFLYDAETDQLTLIDVNFMNYSIGPDGRPKYKNVDDYGIIMMHFLNLNHLTPDEYQLIINSFDSGYKDVIENRGPTDLELKFAFLNELMKEIDHKSSLGQDQNQILHHQIQKLRNLIAESVSADL